ncbi:MAG: CoB--CoM heterodisulfide reductase iron-sulfur subunit B family protein [bacterium]
MKFSYYPGCSLHSTGKEYDESTRAVCQALDIELIEIPDWNCCGASAAHSLNHNLSTDLSGRNLLLAQNAGLDIVVPCSACYSNLKQADKELKEDGEKRQRLEQIVGIARYSTPLPPPAGDIQRLEQKDGVPLSSELKVRHLLDVLYQEVGQIAKMVKKTLSGLKVAPYYGCLITRPPQKDGFDSVEQPQSMDKILEACGCDVVSWSYKTDCCGAGLSLSQTEVVVELVKKLVFMAKRANAECIVTACPLCQTNLEMRQNGTNMPVFYFTEILGLALGMKEVNRWLKRHLVSPMGLVGRC